MFLIFLVLRLLMALLSHETVHQDESMQSVEVAHKLVFGSGHLTWEWLLDAPIRSILYPSVFAFLFQALKVTGMDQPWLIALVPRLFQGMISAVGDCCLLKFFEQNFTGKTKYFLSFYLFNGWMMHISSRTLSNTMEMNLNNIALLYYSRAIKGNSNTLNSITYVILITLSFVVRITTAVFWLPLVAYHAGLLIQSKKFCSVFLLKMVPTASSGMIFALILDYVYYGRFVLVPWNFLKINIFLDISSDVFGKEHFTYYLYASLPRMLNILLLYLPFGVLSTWKKQRTRIYTFSTLWTLLWLSYTDHKETRFITPLIPILLVLSSIGFQHSKPSPKGSKLIVGLYLAFNTCYWIRLQNILAFGSETTDLIQYLAMEFEKGCMANVFFFYCLPAPLYSHFHYNAPLDGVNCPPVVMKGKQIVHADVPDFRKVDPTNLFLEKHGTNLTRDVPSFAVFVESQPDDWPIVNKFLSANDMKLCRKIGIFDVYSRCCRKP